METSCTMVVSSFVSVVLLPQKLFSSSGIGKVESMEIIVSLFTADASDSLEIVIIYFPSWLIIAMLSWNVTVEILCSRVPQPHFYINIRNFSPQFSPPLPSFIRPYTSTQKRFVWWLLMLLSNAHKKLSQSVIKEILLLFVCNVIAPQRGMLLRVGHGFARRYFTIFVLFCLGCCGRWKGKSLIWNARGRRQF
jgi:hypothetical protein